MLFLVVLPKSNFRFVFLSKKKTSSTLLHILRVSRLPNFNWSSLGNPCDSAPQPQPSASQLLQPLRYGALRVDLSSMKIVDIRSHNSSHVNLNSTFLKLLTMNRSGTSASNKHLRKFGTSRVSICFIVGGCQKYPNENKPREPMDLPLALQRTPRSHEEVEPIGTCWRMTTLEKLASIRTSQRS